MFIRIDDKFLNPDMRLLLHSNYIFAQIASIYFNELFIMNLSFKGGTVHLNRSIRIEVIHQNVFSVRSKLLRF